MQIGLAGHAEAEPDVQRTGPNIRSQDGDGEGAGAARRLVLQSADNVGADAEAPGFGHERDVDPAQDATAAIDDHPADGRAVMDDQALADVGPQFAVTASLGLELQPQHLRPEARIPAVHH